MRPYLIAGSILILMMSFQNCGKTASMVDVNSGQTMEATNMTKIRADQFGSLVVTDVENARALEVDLASGQIKGVDDRGVSTGERYCLGEQDRRQLADLLSNAEVCAPLDGAVQVGTVCSMIYRFPYAQLRNASQEVSLGETRNGCEIPVDLCGSKAAQLKSLTADILSRVEHMSCE